ncbi:MFS transporter [soil metagenome]
MKLTEPTPAIRAKAILTSSLGGALENYDFTIYIFVAPILALLFFPSDNSFVSLLNTLGVFAIGYFSRFLGAVLFGHYGDKRGRKKGMLISIAIMALATIFIGFIPAYASIGILAPILLVSLRFLQGIAIGGDLSGAITFVAEYAEPKSRGLSCSFVYCAVNIGIVLASSIAALLTLLLTHEQFISWGWRILFWLGSIIGVVGFYLRSRVAETPFFTELAQSKNIIKFPLFYLFRIHLKELLQAMGLVWLWAVIIAQIFLFMPTYLHQISHLELDKILALNAINTLIFALCIPLMGYLSDKIGRKPLILTTAALFIILSYPLYTQLAYGSIGFKMLALCCFAILSAGIVGTVPCVLSELFPTQVRYSGVAITYNAGFAIFAGLTPMIATYLLYEFHYPQVPSFNIILSAIGAFIVALTIKETNQKILSGGT